MSLNEKLLEIQNTITAFVKDSTIGEGKSAYKAVGSEQVLEQARPLMNELGLLLEIETVSSNILTDKTSTGTSRYLTELHMIFTWIDVESGESRAIKWYGQGVDLAGEKGVGKALTYAEKYFFMKQFHVPTPKDDPDLSKRTKTGELKQAGTQAEKENILLYRQAIPAMISELCNENANDIRQAYRELTKKKDGSFEGFESIDKVPDVILPPLYGKVIKLYKAKTKKEYTPIDTDAAAGGVE